MVCYNVWEIRGQAEIHEAEGFIKDSTWGICGLTHGNKNTAIPSIELPFNIARRNNYLDSWFIPFNVDDTWNDDTGYIL